MGKASFLMVMGLAMVAGIFGAMMNRNATSSVTNYTSYYSRVAARNANNAAIELSLRQLADSPAWRTGYPKVSIGGTNVSLRIDSVSFVDKAGSARQGLKLTSKSAYYSDSLLTRMDTLSASVIVQVPAIPRGIRAAYTAQGPIDHTISDMYIDGENHDTTVVALETNNTPALYTPIPSSGMFGVSTSASTFVNTANGSIGGTDTTVKPYKDIAPAYPNSPKVIE